MKTFLDLALVILSLPVVVSLLTLAFTRYGEARNRRRELFASAFAACQAYREFPFVIRRRGTRDPEGERLRISEDLRVIQKDLSFYQAWVATESPSVAVAYGQFVSELRRIAGGHMRTAWRNDPVANDAEMCISDIDLSALDEPERVYLDAVVRELRFAHTVTSWVQSRRTRSKAASNAIVD